MCMSIWPPMYSSGCPHVCLAVYDEVALWTRNDTCKNYTIHAAPALEAM